MSDEIAANDTTSSSRSRAPVLLIVVLVLAAIAAAMWYLKRPSTVTGTVTLDGKPLPAGLVSLHPVGEGPIPYGRTDDQGRFEIQTGGAVGLAPGSYIVTVAANEPQPTEASEDRMQRVMPLSTPEKYASKETSDLRAEVHAGANQLDLRLEK